MAQIEQQIILSCCFIVIFGTVCDQILAGVKKVPQRFTACCAVAVCLQNKIFFTEGIRYGYTSGNQIDDFVVGTIPLQNIKNIISVFLNKS